MRVVEDGDFAPMIMSSTGGMGVEMHGVIKNLAEQIASKKGEAYSRTVCLLRAKFSFALARASLVCLRGSRNNWKTPRADPIDHMRVAADDLRIDDQDLRMQII